MAYFSPSEQLKLLLVRADVVSAIARVMQRFEDATGQKTYVDRGYSSLSEQAATYADSVAQGFRAAPANLSRHPLGAAVDLRIVGHSHDDAAVDQRDPLYKTLADIAVSEGLVAGYYFSGGKPDPYHLEAKETLAVSQAKWAALTSGRLWRAVGIGAAIAAAILVVRAVGRRRRK